MGSPFHEGYLLHLVSMDYARDSNANIAESPESDGIFPDL